MSELRTQLSITMLFVLFLAGSSLCATERALVLNSGEELPTRLVGLHDGVFTSTDSHGEALTFAQGQWLRWGSPVAPERRPRVLFGRHSSIVAKQDWTGNVPIKMDGQLVTVQNAAIGDVAIRRSDVRCILLEASKEPTVAQQLLREAESQSSDDRVWLVEGDLLRGELIRFDGTSLEFKVAGQVLPIQANRAAAVALGGENTDTQDAGPEFLLGLDDGSLVEVGDLRLDRDSLAFTTLANTTPHNAPAQRVVFVQALKHGITYLSDLTPLDFRHTPYFSISWPLMRDKNSAGGPLAAGGRRSVKGIAMHSASRAVYRVAAGATHFCADVALDGSVGSRGSVVYRVYRVTADGLQMAFESEVVRGGDAPRTINVALHNCAAIVLVVDYADYGDEQDHANWLDARFVH